MSPARAAPLLCLLLCLNARSAAVGIDKPPVRVRQQEETRFCLGWCHHQTRFASQGGAPAAR
jgi:hypothetical protein